MTITTVATTTTPPTTPPLDAVAFASSLHQEVAKLRAAALCQRSLLEAATAQLDTLQVPQADRPAHHLGVMLRTAAETIPTLDDAAARLLAILQDVETLRQQHVEQARHKTHTRAVATPLYPALRDVAARLGMTKSFAVAVDSPSTKPAERYEFFKRLLAALSPQGRDAVVAADVAAELQQLYDAVVDQLPDLDEVAKALTKARDSWRRRGSLEAEDLQQRLQRDLVFQKLDRHVQQMVLLRRGVAAGTGADGDCKEYRDLADLVLATLSSLPLPGGEVQGMVEAVVAEVRRLRGDVEVVATMARLRGGDKASPTLRHDDSDKPRRGD